MLGNAVDGRSLRPVRLIKALRDEVYLRSAGLHVVRTIGSLPLSLNLEATIERNELLATIRQRAQEICTADYRENRARTEQKVLSHFAKTISSLRLAALNDNNTFLLERLLEELRESGSCPYLPPSPARPTEAKGAPSTAPTPAPGGDTPKKATTEPVAAVTPPAAGAAGEPPRDQSRVLPPDEGRTTPERKPSEQPRQRKAQTDEAGGDDDPAAQKSKRSGRLTPPSSERPQPPARSAPAPTPSRAPITVPSM